MRKLLSFVFVLVGFYSYSQSFCGGSSATLQAQNPQNLASPSYSLNPGGFQNSTGVFVVSPPVTTTYTMYTTGQNTANVIVTTSAVTIVTVNAQPNSVPTLTQSTCTSSNNAFNLNLTFNPATPAPTYTIAWSSIPIGVTSPTQYSVSGGAVTAGPYTATVTAAGGCSLIVNFTMDPQPAPAIFSVTPFGATHSITCITPTVVLSTTNPNLTYTWSSTSFTSVVGPTVSLDATSLGTINCTGQNTVSGCTSNYTFLIVQNVSVPSSTLSNTLFNITCTQTVVPTLTIVASPSVNVNNCIISPGATGTFCSSSNITIYPPGIPGTYTVCSLNTENGCSTCKNFTVTSSDSYPTFSVTSPQSFTLGCTTKSVATVNIVNAQTTPTAGGAVSYSLYPPNYAPGIPSGTAPLSPLSTYTVNSPGSWTVVVMDNTNYCKSSNVISILQNTFTPNISATVPRQILDCGYTTTILFALSETPNVSFNWAFVGTPGNVNGPTVTVNVDPAKPTSTLINTYTLSVTDNGNTCKSFSVIPMSQNLFPPNTIISNGGVNALSCKTQSIVLTNQSSTGIPSATGYPTNQPVISNIWYGPPPQEPLQLSTTYVAQVVGTYTLIGKDLNNSCVSSGTIEIIDNIKYPVIAQPSVTPIILDCGANSVIIRPIYTPSTGLSYTWTGLPGSSVGSKSLANFEVTKPFTYSVLAQNISNGCAQTATFTVYNGSLTASFVPDKTSGFAPLTVNFTNNSTSADTATGNLNIRSYWYYSNGDSSITASSSISPQTVYNASGDYKVTMYAHKGTCIDTAYATIKVLVPSSLTVPNVFTPNGDGANDLFFLKADNLTEVTLVIYDRWGHLTYEITSNSGNVEWNGKNQFDKDCAEGVYYYYLKAKGLDGESYDLNGSINLLR